MLKLLSKILLLLPLILCIACSGKSASTAKTLTVTLHSNTNTLYFSGTISPLANFSINTPVDANVLNKCFDYGETVKKKNVYM